MTSSKFQTFSVSLKPHLKNSPCFENQHNELPRNQPSDNIQAKFLLGVVMRSFFIFVFCFFSSLRAEVYDCFCFFNELELLKLRFEELYDVVDHFVIVESPISFTGKSKPLYFQENARDFEKYKNKIIHVIIDHFPDLTSDEENNHWYRESYSRNAILRGLNNCKDDDVIFISDVDEIPRATVIGEVQQYLKRFKKIHPRVRKMANLSKLVCGLEMRLFMYSMNRENLAGWYGGSKGTLYWVVSQLSPWGIKLFHHNHAMQKFTNAGWHFNTMGGQDRSLYKWLNTGPIYYEGSENALLALGQNPDLLNQSYNGQVATNTIIVPIDDTYPKYFLENIEYFRKIGWISE